MYWIRRRRIRRIHKRVWRKWKNRIDELKSKEKVGLATDKCDNDNISKEDKKRYILDSLNKQPNNPSLHQMNIVTNNDSDESQHETDQNALEHCPNDHVINHIVSMVYQRGLSKGKNIMKKKKIQ